MLNCWYREGFSILMREAFAFFCKVEINFLFQERKIVIGNLEEQIKSVTSIEQIQYLSEEEFFDFSNLVREACGDRPIDPPEPDDPNEDPRIRQIKEKARKRDRIKAKQGRENGISLETCLVAICCMGIGITPLNIGEMSYASVGEIMRVMQDKEKYDIDIRSLLAGADSKKIKPKYWIRNTNN
jgi:predicted  nucleic acid-binding Zn-ribbon protein